MARPAALPVPIFPSSVIPTLETTSGRPVVMWQAKGSMSRPASSAHSPTSTRMPAERSLSTPRPETAGLGSVRAATTRRTPARTSASAQGGVRPSWEQGSSVTYTTAPAARRPAILSAPTSAWSRRA